MTDYSVEILEDPSEFLAITAAFRSAEPVLTNVMSTIVGGVLDGHEYDSCAYYVVRDHGQIAGIALRTAPRNLNVSPMPDDAAAALGRTLRTTDPHLPGISGPAATVARVWSEFNPDLGYQIGMSDVVYELVEFREPDRTAGSARVANEADLELIIDWLIQFGRDAGVPMPDPSQLARRRLAAAQYLLWCDPDDQPVALAAHNYAVGEPPGRTVRIGPVFTPAAHRGLGYGTAVTAALISRMQDACDRFMLFADEANPASNAVYRRLGFEVVARTVETYALYD